MSKITLKPVQYYDVADIYTYEVDNRPLYDLSYNLDKINTSISQLGFYQEVYANPETEPAGGFSPLSCAMYGQNGRLYPIDISQDITILDYSKYPIYLILEKLGPSLYKCLAFSASLVLPTLFNKFLPDSIGRAIKVGPGGSLVDEIYFDLYYSDYSYQTVIVGKVLTPTSIAFGGNQVSTLGDNRFLAKNRDETTTGLLTKIISNDINSTVIKSSLVNNAFSSYPFTEYVNQSAGTLGIAPGKTPVYFSSLPLSITDGSFNVAYLENVLNEVHFAAPTVSSENQTDSKYKTAGVNINSLLSFSQSFLLHSKQLSTNLNEVSQNISTSLAFSTDTSNGLKVSFTPSLAPFGTVGGSASLTGMVAATNTSGILFGSDTNNASLYYLLNSTESASAFTEDVNSFSIASLVNSNALVLKVSGANSTFALSSDGPIVFNSGVGTFIFKSPELGYEITNKIYVDGAVLAATGTAKTKIPLSGSTTDIPITGSLYFDVKGSTTPNVVFQFDSLITADIQSSYPIEIKTLATSDYQVIRADTPTNILGDPKDLTNRTFVQGAISDAIAGAIGSNFVSRINADTIEASKTFNASAQIITNHATPVVINPPTGNSVDILSNAQVINFVAGDTNVILTTSTTQDSDPDTTVVTKDYMLQKITDKINLELGEKVYGIWHSSNVASSTTLAQFAGWKYGTRGGAPDQSSSNFYTYFTPTDNGALVYIGTSPSLFSVAIQDARVTAVGPAFPGGIFRTQTYIVVMSGSTMLQIARNIHQDDTDGNSVNSLVGSSCAGTVYLQNGDVLYLLSEQAEVVSASIVRIR